MGKKFAVLIQHLRKITPEWRFLDRGKQADKLASGSSMYSLRGVEYNSAFFILNWACFGTSIELDGNGQTSAEKTALAIAANAGRSLTYHVLCWCDNYAFDSPLKLSAPDLTQPFKNTSNSSCSPCTSSPQHFVGVSQRGSCCNSNVDFKIGQEQVLAMSCSIPHSYQATGEWIKSTFWNCGECVLSKHIVYKHQPQVSHNSAAMSAFELKLTTLQRNGACFQVLEHIAAVQLFDLSPNIIFIVMQHAGGTCCIQWLFGR